MKHGLIALLTGLFLIGCAGEDEELAAKTAYYMSEPGYGLNAAPMSSMRGARGHALIPEPTSCPNGWDLYPDVRGGVYEWLCCPPGADLVACANFYCDQQEGIPDRVQCGVCKEGEGRLAEAEVAEVPLVGARQVNVIDRPIDAPPIIACEKGQIIDVENCVCKDGVEEVAPEPEVIAAP